MSPKKRRGLACLYCWMAVLLSVGPVRAQTVCSANNPAAISGSTGAQGVLDPANANASLGLVWPATAVKANIALDTGQVLFTDSSNTQVGAATLPGVSGFPAFPTGALHFTAVHLPAGKTVSFSSSSLGFPPPVLILSCQDVILEAGSTLGVGGGPNGRQLLQGSLVQFPGNFLGGNSLNPVNIAAAGYGPRSGSLPAAGSLYPPIGGSGGNGGTGQFCGGEGGEAMVIAAAQRIAANGDILANGNAAPQVSTTIQGGAGGSVRLAAVLVEGAGAINTSGGKDSDGVVRSPAGPIEIQAFVKDLFTGTGSTAIIRDKPVAAPVPSNLPALDIVGVVVSAADFCGLNCANTGSLTAPDVTLPPAASPASVTINVDTQDVPVGTILDYRAVGADGSVSTASASVQACDCSVGKAFSSAALTLNPGVNYQIVVAPSSSFLLAAVNPISSPLTDKPFAEQAQQKLPNVPGAVPDGHSEAAGVSSVERWAKAFGARPEVYRKLAQVASVP